VAVAVVMVAAAVAERGTGKALLVASSIFILERTNTKVKSLITL